MFKQWKRYHLLIMCMVLALMTTACFRDSAEGVVAQPVSQLLPTDIPPTAQADEPSATPTELIKATEEVVFEKPTETSVPTATSTPTIVVQAATATMTVDPLLARLTATETEEGIVNVGNTIPGGTVVAQRGTEAPPDNFALTSTALIGQLTQDAAAVATAQAIQAGLGAATPTPLGPPTIDPFLATPTFVPARGLVSGADCVHQIRAGETLFKLSLAYGVSVSDMQLASNIANPNLILVGQRITIPRCGTTGFTPPPTSIPVASSTPVVLAQVAPAIGATGNTATTDPLAAQAQSDITNNAQVDIQSNAVAQGAAPLVGRTQYTVQQYDTLFQIAQAYNTTVDAIATLNGITNINSITMGDVLQIP
jgi:LysM repeat protein